MVAADPPKLDRYGDPLPAGAVARFGSTYLNSRGYARNYRFAPDGKTFHAEAAGPAKAEYDAATGKLLRRVPLPGLAGSWPWLSADGSLAVCEQPGGVHRVVEVATGKTRFDLPAEALIHPIVFPFSQDGRRLVTLDRTPRPFQPQRIRVWDTATGEARNLGLADAFRPRAVLSPDGSVLVTDGDSPAVCRDVATGKEMWRDPPDRRPASAPFFSPDGRRLARKTAPVGDAPVEVLDVATGKPLAGFKPLPPVEIEEAHAFTPDGTALLASGERWREGAPEGRSGIWDLAAGAWRARWRSLALDGGVLDPAAQTVLAAGGPDGRFRRWDIAAGKQLYPDVADLGHTHDAGEPGFDGTGRKVFTLGGDLTLREWDATDGRLVRSVRTLPPPADQGGPRLAVRPDGGRVVVDGRGFQILRRVLHVVDFPAGTRREIDLGGRRDGFIWYGRPRLLADGTLRRVADGRRYNDGGGWTGGDDAEDWDLTAGTRLRGHPFAHQATPRHWTLGSTNRRAAELSPDGRLASDGTAVADVETGKVLFRLAGDGLEGRPEAAFSADGRRVAVRTVNLVRVPATNHQFGVGRGREFDIREEPAGVWVWDVPTGKPVGRIAVGADRMDLTPDGRFLLTLDATGVSAWDVATGKQVVHHKSDPRGGHLEGRTFTQSLVSAPDGRTAVTARFDGTCLLWDFSAAYR